MQTFNEVEDDEGKAVYEQLLTIRLDEMKRLIDYKDNQSISTQHGVKGEGHTKVCFWSEASKSHPPRVYMYDFFEMYVHLDEFKLENFQNFYYKFKSTVAELESELGDKIKDLKAKDITDKHLHLFDQTINNFSRDIYFVYIFNNELSKYDIKRKENKKPTITSIRSIFKPDVVNRILVAYKLFYVGCSRAKNELVVLVDQEKVSSFKDGFIRKMVEVGFEVIKKEEKVLKDQNVKSSE